LPERKGQQLARVSEALEPFDGDEPVHALKLGLEACCVLQIVAMRPPAGNTSKITAIITTSLRVKNVAAQ
jgi:hypothetical protein